MTKMMKWRVVTIKVGLWEDKESFPLNEQEIVHKMLIAFPGGSVGISEDDMYEYEVNE